MSFEQISYLAQIVASVGVIVSLIFVALQIKHNTGGAPAQRAQFDDGAVDGDPHGHRQKP